MADESQLAAQNLMIEMGLDGHDIERRQKMVGLVGADLDRIRAIRDVVIDHTEEYMTRFFDHLSGFREAEPLLRTPALIERARRLKREHLAAMVQGNYGMKYVEQRLELGSLYAAAGLPSRLFLGAFHELLKQVGTRVMKRFERSPLEGFENFMSLKKVAFFDIGLIVDILVFERERIIHQQKEAIREGSRLKSEFLANMSHELRTPLNSIIGFAELLHDGEVGPILPKQEEFLGDVLTSGRHLLQLINDVLDLSKVEAGKLEFHPEVLDLERVIAEVTSVLRATATAKCIEIDTVVEPELGPIVLDESRLKQVLYNYLSNALKFTPEGGKVAVRALGDGPRFLRIEVEDTGIGIAADDIGRLFNEFQQLDAGASKVHAGTGLGLALTKRLVEAQGGTVGARSEPGNGSLFHAALPRAMQARARVILAGNSAGARRVDPLTVLVVEDEPGDQAAIERALAGAGYSVEVVATGAEAISRCREREYAAVTLDLNLPDMSGLDVLKAVRAGGKSPGVPIVVVTAVAERATGGFVVHDVLSKPVDARALVTCLQSAPISSRSNPILVVDDDPGSLKLVATLLEQLGYRPICYTDGLRALRSIETEPPVAIVLDLLMPGFDGFQFLGRLREARGDAPIPVLVWTMKDLTNQELETLRLSASTVVAKGGGSAELAVALRTYVGANETGASHGG